MSREVARLAYAAGVDRVLEVVGFYKRSSRMAALSHLPASDGAESVGVPQLLRQSALVLPPSPLPVPLLLPLVDFVHQHLAGDECGKEI